MDNTSINANYTFSTDYLLVGHKIIRTITNQYGRVIETASFKATEADIAKYANRC